MTTLIVNIKDNGDVRGIADALRLMKGVGKVSVADTSVRRMTIDEYDEMVGRSLADAREGRTITQEELEKEAAKW